MKTSDILKELGEAIVKGLRVKLSSNGIDSSSTLSNQLDYTVKHDTFLYIDMPEYGVYVDSGTKPHMPPVDKLERWATSRGLNAWAVAMNIKKYGTKPKPFLYVIDDIVKKFEPELIKHYGAEINKNVLSLLTHNFPNSKIIK